MSTTLLYRAFGIQGYHYVRRSFQGGQITFTIEQPRERLRCSQCGEQDVWAQGGEERSFRTVPIGSKPVTLKLKVPRVRCFACGMVRQVKVGFAEPRKHYTRSFERYALDLSRSMTIKDVATHLQVSWDTIKDIQASSERHGKLLKGTRWLLLKNPENLYQDRNERRRLQQALTLNLPLTIAYYLKEDLRQIWSQPNKRTARRGLRDWQARARATDIRILHQFANTLEEHQEGILAYYDYPIATGPLEGTNTKIQAMKRQAFGFRDREFYNLKILGLHETKHALVG